MPNRHEGSLSTIRKRPTKPKNKIALTTNPRKRGHTRGPDGRKRRPGREVPANSRTCKEMEGEGKRGGKEEEEKGDQGQASDQGSGNWQERGNSPGQPWGGEKESARKAGAGPRGLRGQRHQVPTSPEWTQR